MGIAGKFERNTGLKNTRNALIEALVDGVEDEEEVASMTKDAKKIWSKMVSETMRRNVVESGIRIDGRQTDVRPMSNIVCDSFCIDFESLFRRLSILVRCLIKFQKLLV